MNTRTAILRVIPIISVMISAACSKSVSEIVEPQEGTTLSVALPSSGKTYMGPIEDGKRNVFWSEGDCISVNGITSVPLGESYDGKNSATFSFPEILNTPYNILYPASFYKDAGTITLPASQTYAAGTFADGAEPMAGYSSSAEGDISLAHLCGVLILQVKKDAGVSASNLTRISFRGNSGEQVSGDFSIDYELASISGVSASEDDKSVSLALNQPLSESDVLELYLIVPAVNYASGFSVELEDALSRSMTATTSKSKTVQAGKAMRMQEFTFVPGLQSIELESIVEEILPFDHNVTGRVVDNAGDGIEGVVVSDGLNCVRTMYDGSFYMTSNTSSAKFIFVSSPSGYKPAVSGGIPRFYKALSDITPINGIYNCGNFVMTPVSNPNRFTVLMSGDPQPRKTGNLHDKIAYHSLSVLQDYYQELYDVAGSISDREVFGICLGDLVHENMSLLDTYAEKLNLLNFPTYNVIGNHDHDPDATDDASGAAPFESFFGPTNYSFNMGGLHFVVLDNMIMSLSGGQLTSATDGLTDEIWTWLQNDLSFVPKSTKLMICSHSPMFRQYEGKERSQTAQHGPDYGDLLRTYSMVHAWNGHNHLSFNYVYPSGHRYHNKVEAHSIVRCAGELWTNEYLSGGTPRGFVVIDVDNGNISWKFHPISRQRTLFDSAYCSAPSYQWRDWNYNDYGTAVMKVGGGALTDDYQMHAYPRGAYGDNYVYANVFLWDESWENPVFTPTGGSGVTMERVTADDRYDLANWEIRNYYDSNASIIHNDHPTYITGAKGNINTIFRAPANATPSSGIISVTDRFGNTYTAPVSW